MSRYLTILTVLLASLLAVSAQAADGAALYKSKCATCHAADGSGDTAMGKKLGLRSLALPEVQKQSDADLTAITKKGKGKMPAYDGKLSDAEIQAVIAHIRTFAKK